MEVLRVGNDAYFMNLKPLSIITPGARGAFSHEHGHFPYNNLKLLTAWTLPTLIVMILM